MGIDIPDIHLIIQYGISKNIESYYQEIVRGGRDGNMVKCYVFWSVRDFITNRYFIQNIKNEEFKNSENHKLQELQKYINTNNCRMKYICNYFDDKINKVCEKCDNCILRNEKIKAFPFAITTNGKYDKNISNNINQLFNKFKLQNNNNNNEFMLEKVYDISANKCLNEEFISIRYIILLFFTSINKGLGIKNIVKILIGKHKDYKDHCIYGILSHMKIEDIKNYIKKIYYSKYIDYKSIRGNELAKYYCINNNGKNWYRHYHRQIEISIDKITLLQQKFKQYYKNNISIHKISNNKTTNNKTSNKNLKLLPVYKNLKEWRYNKAKDINKKPFCIFTNKILEDITIIKPITLSDLKNIKGLGPKKLANYGNDIINIIK